MDANQAKRLIASRNAAMNAKFIKICAPANWRLLTQADVVDPHQTPRLIVIGVALWSPPDLQALNMLAEKFDRDNTTVFVFDIDEFGFSEGVKAFIPGVEMPNKTPVVAEYINGTLVGTHQGDAAFKWIRDL